MHRKGSRVVELDALRRAGGRGSEDDVSRARRGAVASDDLSQHSAARDDTGEDEKRIELHGVLESGKRKIAIISTVYCVFVFARELGEQ